MRTSLSLLMHDLSQDHGFVDSYSLLNNFFGKKDRMCLRIRVLE